MLKFSDRLNYSVNEEDATSQDAFCWFSDFRKTENNIFKVFEKLAIWPQLKLEN